MVGVRDDEAVLATRDLNIFCKMPEAFDQVTALSFTNVANQADAVWAPKYKPSMQHRRRQPRISIVPGNQEVETISTHPALDSRFGNCRPGKRAGNERLILLVDSHRIVSTGAAEDIALVRIGNIGRGPRIDEHPSAVHCHPKAERVGMPVPAAADTLRAGINHDLVRAGFVACQEVDSAGGKRF